MLQYQDSRQLIILLIACIGLKCCLADDRKTTNELIRSRGFDLDEWDVVSQDYPLKVYRLINPLAEPASLNRVPVIFGHGISFDMTNMMSSSKNARPRKPDPQERVTLLTLENGTDDRGIHFYLSNNNYDVWLLESRAVNNLVQRRLPSLNHNRVSFWDFSIDEQALIDLPLQIDFVLKRTNSTKAAFVGYSQSTTFMFALLSMQPEFSQKLACFVALAPVVYTTHLHGSVLPATLVRLQFGPSSSADILPSWLRTPLNFGITYVCSISFFQSSLCRLAWASVGGLDNSALLEKTMIEDVLKSTSMKTLEQYVQNALNRDFRMFDYKDSEKNNEIYGQDVPPRYNISRITLETIALFRGTHDYLSSPQDQMVLLNRLKVPLIEDHILEHYSHIDFIVSPTVTRDVNEPVLRLIDRLTGRHIARDIHELSDEHRRQAADEESLALEREAATVEQARLDEPSD